MKRWLLMILVVFWALPMVAQIDADIHYKANARYWGIGIKGGVSLPNYHYGARGVAWEDLNALPFDSLKHRIRPAVGVQVEIPVGKMLMVSPELMLIRKGDNRRYKNIPSGDSLTYTAKVNYLDLRVPIALQFFASSRFSPYIFAGPDISMVLPYVKNINFSGFFMQGGDVVEVNASNMAPFDVGAFAGVGFRYRMEFARFSLVMKLEAAYSMGLMETYSKKELNSQVPAVNLGAGGTHYSVGHRYNRGWECTFSLVLPMHFKGGDACSSFPSDLYGYGR